MSRRSAAVTIAIVTAVCVAGWSLARQRPTLPRASAVNVQSIDVVYDPLLALARQWARDGTLVRPDGYVYTIDLAQLITVFHRAGDAASARHLTDIARRHLIRTDRSDPFTDGFVGWRFKPGQSLDASGTTEALRMIEALLLSDAPADIALAVGIAHGYARHAGVDQDVWIIRNYFNFGTRAFATNTYLVDYDPDLLATLADRDPALRETAERSAVLVRGSAAPCGLIYDIIQPEVVTLMPDGAIRAFSPNDIVQLANSATVAERSVRTCPQIARGVLRFAVDAARRHGVDDLPSFYLGRTGEPLGESRAGGETIAALLRLAILLEDREAVALLAPALIRHAREFVDNPIEPRAYRAVEMLMGLQALRRSQAVTPATAPSSR